WVTSMVGFHPEIVPSSVTNMKKAFCPGATSKLVVKLKTFPVGEDGPFCPGGGGIVTTNGCGVPVALYKVETPVPLSDTHHGPPEERESPQAFTRLGSMFGTVATVGELAVRSVRVKCCPKALLVTIRRRVSVSERSSGERFAFDRNMGIPPAGLVNQLGAAFRPEGDNLPRRRRQIVMPLSSVFQTFVSCCLR